MRGRPRCLPPNASGVVRWLPVLTLAIACAPAATPTAGQATVDRWVRGPITPDLDSTRPGSTGTADHTSHHDPRWGWRVEVDAETGHLGPGRAERAPLGPDGTSWALRVRTGVQSHQGYGACTAKNVVHTHARWGDAHSPGRQDPPTRGSREGLGAVERLEVIHAPERRRRCRVAGLDRPCDASRAANVRRFRTPPWDAAGERGEERQAAGTGPAAFKERP
jgi:hypothetical protein